MVKWMTKIIITEKESDNYYHFFDNRILPPQVPRPAQVTTHACWRTVVHTNVSCLSLSDSLGCIPPALACARVGRQGDCRQGRLVVQARVSL